MNYTSIAETQMSSRPLILIDNLWVSADYAKYSPFTSSNNQIPFFNDKSFSLTTIKNLLNFYIFFISTYFSLYDFSSSLAN